MLRQLDRPALPECGLFLTQPSACRPGEVISENRKCDSSERANGRNARLVELIETLKLDDPLVRRIKALICSETREFLKELELELLRAILNSALPDYHTKIASIWLECEKYFLNSNKELVD